MTKLEICREKIDNIDSEIIQLFEERMNVVKEVTQYKIENDMQVLDSSREGKMLEKNLNKIQNEEYKKYYIEILKAYLTVSKQMQTEIIEKNKNK